MSHRYRKCSLYAELTPEMLEEDFAFLRWLEQNPEALPPESRYKIAEMQASEAKYKALREKAEEAERALAETQARRRKLEQAHTQVLLEYHARRFGLGRGISLIDNGPTLCA